MEIRDRIRELRRVPASELVPNPKNWRTHPERQRSAMSGVLAEIGYANALVAREDEVGRLILIDGHLRRETTPDSLVPVLVLDVTEKEAEKILATMDPLSKMAEQDTEALAVLLKSLDEDGDRLSHLVFPDYIREALFSADWDKPTAEPGGLDVTNPAHLTTIRVTAEQNEVILRAVEKVRTDEGNPDLTEGRCLELICADFVA
jgi:hypothetical protein